MVAEALAARGLGETSLIADWPAIVGETLPVTPGRSSCNGRLAPPNAIPTRRPLPRRWCCRVEGAFALEAQHSASVIVARVNAHLGWRCVDKIAFRQGPLPAAQGKAPRRAGSRPTRRKPPRAPPPRRSKTTELRDAVDAARRAGDRQVGPPARHDGRPNAPRETEGLISRHPLAGRAIARMNGAGNTILVLDMRGSPLAPTPEDARAIHRAPGSSYDQMMVLGDPQTRGNRGRRAHLQQRRHARRRLRQRHALRRRPVVPRARGRRRQDRDRGRRDRLRAARTLVLSGRHGRAAPRLGRHSASRMPCPTRGGSNLWPDGEAPAELGPASVVNMGNPHAVFFVPDLEAHRRGGRSAPRIEVDPMFPEKANVTFARSLRRDEVRRGCGSAASALTLACGSAACATLVAAARLGLMERKGTVRLPGGELIIEWRAADDHVLMTGPVEYEGAFILDDALFEAAAP